METCIAIEHLTRRFGRTVAVDDLCLEVGRGRVLGLLGPNGAGKSTTIGMLAGLIRPTSGSVSLFGMPLNRHFLEIMAKTGVLVERPSFPEYLTVRRVLKLHALMAGCAGDAVDGAMARTGLTEAAGEKVGTLSQGMRQRLGIAQAILAEPELLILDEPTSGLDAESTRQILVFLKKLASEAGVTILFSSHQMTEVEQLCDMVAVMRRGRLIACETKASLLSRDFTRATVLLDRAGDAVAALRGQPWVSDAAEAPEGLQVVLCGAETDTLSAFLVERGFRLSGVIPGQASLEEYFFKVTGA